VYITGKATSEAVIKDFDAGLFARGIILRTRNQTFYVRAKVTKKYFVEPGNKRPYCHFYPICETAAGIPNAKLILYQGLGHNTIFAHNRQFSEDIVALLKS